MKLKVVVDYYEGDPGEFIKVDEEKCNACAECAKTCPRGVWRKIEKIFRPLNLKECVECGSCWTICPEDAIDYGEPKGGTGVRFKHG